MERHPSPCRVPRPRPRPERRGFALVMVLWVLAGLTVVAAAVASSVQSSNRNVKLLRDRVRIEVGFLNAAARLQVIVASGTPTASTIVSPLGTIYADDRPYAAGDNEWASIQDVRGLVRLNRPNRDLEGLLRQCGAAEADTAGLIDTLEDYVDDDALKRLNGAEAFDYRQAGLEEPRNASLLSREELWRVKGWSALKPAWDAAACSRLVTVHGDSAFNPNTAPAPVLIAQGYAPEVVAGFLQARGDSVLTEAAANRQPKSTALNQLGGGSVGRTLRITHFAAPVEWSWEYELRLTPNEPGGPWKLLELRYPPRSSQLPLVGLPLPTLDSRAP